MAWKSHKKWYHARDNGGYDHVEVLRELVCLVCGQVEKKVMVFHKNVVPSLHVRRLNHTCEACLAKANGTRKGNVTRVRYGRDGLMCIEGNWPGAHAVKG